MATFSISDIAIKGISCCVPKNKQLNRELSLVSSDEIEKFIEATGVEERRIADDKTCTSDLCFYAAEKLISELKKYPEKTLFIKGIIEKEQKVIDDCEQTKK